MKNTNDSLPDKNSVAKLSLRGRYLLEKQQIQNEIGDLDQILKTLGMSQRRVCQLLLVDPSAWTRWNKTGAPPHIFQALRWLIQLKKINPDVVRPTDLAARLDYVQTHTHDKIKSLENNFASLERSLSFAPAVIPERNFSFDATTLLLLEQKLMKTIGELEVKISELALKPKNRGKFKVRAKSKIKTRRKRSKKTVRRATVLRKKNILKSKAGKRKAPARIRSKKRVLKKNR